MKRRNINEISLSFLDVLCCGFGAVILLLMIIKLVDPIIVHDPTFSGSADLPKRETIRKIVDKTDDLRDRLAMADQDASRNVAYLANVRKELEEIEHRYVAKAHDLGSLAFTKQQLLAAKQSLTDEMERLLGVGFIRSDNLIGGITVDSEYIIFIIDTSGSMRRWAWGLLQRKIRETLSIYPTVKGIQLLNASGEYLFPEFAGQWISDSASRRRQISARLASWRSESESTPVNGIRHAISTFYSKERKISIYIFGDDFRGGSIENVVDTVDGINRSDTEEGRRVRIHAVGFPVVVGTPSGNRFAALMRELTYRNGGTFVGLSTVND